MTVEKTVLIADDSKDMLAALSHRCKAMGLNVVPAVDGSQAVALLRRQRPDLAILDLEMPGIDGLSICERMAQDKQTAAVPVIILTGRSYLEAVRRCEAAGAYYVFKDRQAWQKLRSIIRAELGVEVAADPSLGQTSADSEASSTGKPRPKILLVDDDLNILQVFKIRLTAFGAQVVTAKNGMNGFTAAAMEMPDVIVTDYTMPGGSGEYLLNCLSGDPSTKDIPVIILTGRTFDGGEDVALKRDMVGRGGAVAYFNKPVDMDLLLAELQKQITLRRAHLEQSRLICPQSPTGRSRS